MIMPRGVLQQDARRESRSPRDAARQGAHYGGSCRKGLPTAPTPRKPPGAGRLGKRLLILSRPSAHNRRADLVFRVRIESLCRALLIGGRTGVRPVGRTYTSASHSPGRRNRCQQESRELGHRNTPRRSGAALPFLRQKAADYTGWLRPEEGGSAICRRTCLRRKHRRRRCRFYKSFEGNALVRQTVASIRVRHPRWRVTARLPRETSCRKIRASTPRAAPP